jgi:hypothetical protein
LKHVVRQLEVADLEYMVSGSVASSLQGEPRASHDIDIVVAVRAEAAEVAARLKAVFPEPDFYLDEGAMREAIVNRSMFNLLETREGDTVDFWLLTDDDFDRARFARRYAEVFEGQRLMVSRPEDTILMKLRGAAMMGGSEKQFNDALRVWEVQHGRLDERYLDRWAPRLGVADALARLRREARPL